MATYVSVVGALSGVGLLAFLDVGGGLSQKGGFVDKFGTILFFLSVFGFMGALPLILAPFTRDGALGVFALEIVLVTVYIVGRRGSSLSRHSSDGRGG